MNNLCEECEVNEKVGEWNYCYECFSECAPFPICPRCYCKIYDDYCESCDDIEDI